MNFSNVILNLKMSFSVAFSLVSKFASCPLAATDIAGAGFIPTIPDAEEIAVAVLVEWEVRMTIILPISCGYRNRCLIIHRRKSEWHYEFNKLKYQNINVYLSLLKKITLIVGYIFVASLKSSSRLASSKQKFSESLEFAIYTTGLETIRRESFFKSLLNSPTFQVERDSL